MLSCVNHLNWTVSEENHLFVWDVVKVRYIMCTVSIHLQKYVGLADWPRGLGTASKATFIGVTSGQCPIFMLKLLIAKTHTNDWCLERISNWKSTIVQ